MAKYCASCGTALGDDEKFCPNCGAPVENEKVEVLDDNEKNSEEKVSTYHSEGVTSAGKSKIAAGLLAIFLGCFGVHNFYLGYNGKAIAQLLLTLLGWILCFSGPFASAIWGLVEGILIFTGSISTDAQGNPLDE